MTVATKINHKDLFMGKLRYGDDLLEEVSKICKEKNIRLGRIEAIGAVQKVCIGYYDQRDHTYAFHTIDQPLEITNLTGNISVKDGDPFVHAHVTLANASGQAFGGHLAPGTIVFACEWVIEAFDGPALVREYDAETGLPLWKK